MTTGDDASITRPPAIRASDDDRERAAERLRVACTEGRLTLEETTERLGHAYRATTLAELDELLLDLPAPGVAGAVAPQPVGPAVGYADPGPPQESYVAVFGGSERRGRWRVPCRSRAVAVFGGVQLDLRQAQLAAQTVEIRAVAVFGGVEIALPEGVDVQMSGWAVFGGKSARVPEAPPGAPVVRVKAVAVFGGVEAKVKRDWSEVAETVRRAIRGDGG